MSTQIYDQAFPTSNVIKSTPLIDAFYATPANGGFVFYREEFPPASLIEQWKPMDPIDRPLIKLP